MVVLVGIEERKKEIYFAVDYCKRFTLSNLFEQYSPGFEISAVVTSLWHYFVGMIQGCNITQYNLNQSAWDSYLILIIEIYEYIKWALSEKKRTNLRFPWRLLELALDRHSYFTFSCCGLHFTFTGYRKRTWMNLFWPLQLEAAKSSICWVVFYSVFT